MNKCKACGREKATTFEEGKAVNRCMNWQCSGEKKKVIKPHEEEEDDNDD